MFASHHQRVSRKHLRSYQWLIMVWASRGGALADFFFISIYGSIYGSSSCAPLRLLRGRNRQAARGQGEYTVVLAPARDALGQRRADAHYHLLERRAVRLQRVVLFASDPSAGAKQRSH